MKQPIKPCPFCGSKRVDVCRTNNMACWVQCIRCGGRTGSMADRGDAISMWNRRIVPATDRPAQIVQDDDLDWDERDEGDRDEVTA